MESYTALFSIRPKHAEKIFNGTKKVELRRVRPKIKKGDIVLVYVSSPVKELRGQFEVEKVVEEEISELWNNVKFEAGVSETEFFNYFNGLKTGIGIYLKAPTNIRNPISLDGLRKLFVNFHPPQSFRYISISEFQQMTSRI